MKNLTRRDLVSSIFKEGKLKLNSRDSVLIGEDESGLRVTLGMILMTISDVYTAEMNSSAPISFPLSSKKSGLGSP